MQGTWQHGKLVDSHELPAQLLADIKTVAAAAAFSADPSNHLLKNQADLCAMESTQMRRGFLSLSPTISEFQSKHPYDNDTDEWGLIHFPPAVMSVCTRISITFDPQTRTETNRDFVQFFDSSRRHALSPKFSGRGSRANFPGLNGNPALEISGSSVMYMKRLHNLDAVVTFQDRFHFTSDSANNDWGYVFYACATWGPHALNFPHPPGIGGSIWDEKAEKAYVTRFKPWEDAPREEQARVNSMMKSLVCGWADSAVIRCETRKDALACSQKLLSALVQSSADKSEAAAAAARAADLRMRIRLRAANTLSATYRRTRDSFTYRQSVIVPPSVPQHCKRLLVAIQESKLSFVFLRHILDTGIDDQILSNVTVKTLLEKNLATNDAIRLFSAADAYNKAHAAADAAESALQHSIHVLESASQTLRHLTVNDVLEIRGMTTPSLGVKLLMQCVCIVLRVKPLVKIDALRQPVYDFWEPAKQNLLVDPKAFLERLWTAIGQDIDDSVLHQVEECLEKPEMSSDRLKRITKSSVSDVAEWLRALCSHHRAKKAASKESLVYLTSESASRRLFVSPTTAVVPAPPDDDALFMLTNKGKTFSVPAAACGILIVLAFGPRVNAGSRDVQSATGYNLSKIENMISAMAKDGLIIPDKVVGGFPTYSLAVGVSFDAATASRHCKSLGFFKVDLSYALQVRSLASLSVSVYEKKLPPQIEQKAGGTRRK